MSRCLTFEDACLRLSAWIALSQGVLIDTGHTERQAFRRTRHVHEIELHAFEQAHNLALPKSYRQFLIGVGAVEIFSGERTAGIDILPPADIAGFSASVFSNYGEDLFPQVLLAVSLPKFGYFGGFLMDSTEQNYSLFYPDIPPELWIEESEPLDFESWLVQLVNSRATKV